MGFFAIATLAVSAATTVAQSVQARKAAKAQREGNAIASAGQEVQDRVARRRAMREARIRRAMVLNSATQSGAAGSSGEIGAISAIGSNTASSIANQSGERNVALGVGRQQQIAADAESKFDQIGSFGKLVNQGIGLWDEYKKGS